MAQPNLTPYQPAGWSDKIVVTRTSGSTADSAGLTTADTLYVDFAVINDGTASTGIGFYNYLYLDGGLLVEFNSSALPADGYTYFIGFDIGQLSAGNHTVEIVADATGVITETNESDNTYTKNITVSTINLPNLTPVQPAGWSDKIVVTRTPGTTTDSTGLTVSDTLYVDWAVTNNGTGPTTNAFLTYLYVDGVMKTNWSTPSPLNTNGLVAVTNYSIGSLSEGSHTIQITADATGVVAETNETDNSYSKPIFVNFANLAAPTLISPANSSSGQSPQPTFTWSAIGGAAGYRIIAATNAADLPSDPSATNGGASVVVDDVAASTSYTPSMPFNTSTTYYWEVRGTNVNQNGIWSMTNSFTTGTLTGGLTIVPTFDSSITSNPQASMIESTIKSAIVAYQMKFSDPVTVTITFQTMPSGLGRSLWYYDTFSYSSYLSALMAHATTADDATAIANLPNVANNPVNGNANLNIKLPNARALGFSADPNPGSPDGVIYLNVAKLNFSTAMTNGSKLSLFAVASHEIDEVLGLGSALDEVFAGIQSSSDPILPEDLFRYDQFGARTYTTNTNAIAYFSLNGTTDVAQFNQDPSGDYGDWYSIYGGQTPEVQDAFSIAGASPVLGAEARALDAIGFTLVQSVPQPVILSVVKTNSSVVFAWSAISGQKYQVLGSTNLASQTWTNIGSSITASGTNASFTNTIGPDKQRFYRVEVSTNGGNVVLGSVRVSGGPAGSGSSGVQPSP